MKEVVVAGVPFLVQPAAGRCPVLLLHGFVGHPSSWSEVVARLGHASLAAPFLPGHDGYPGWFRGSRFEEVVDALAAALPLLSPQGWHVAGYSLGARVGLALVVRYPERFQGATLIGVRPGLRSAAERKERREADARWVQLLRTAGLAAFLDAWEQQPLFASQQALPPARRAAQRAVRQRHSAEGLARCLEVLGLAEMPDLWPALPHIQVPVRLVVGARDTAFWAVANEMLASLPRGELAVVPDAGHNVVLEAPAAVARWLASAAAAPGDEEVP